MQLLEVAERTAPDLVVTAEDDSIRASVGSRSVVRPIHRRSSVTPSVASRLVGEADRAGMVVADQIASTAKETLQDAGWSFWDRRGRLRLWLPELGTRLDVPTPSFVTGADGPNPRRPFAGVGGISVAVALLIEPEEPFGVREVARLAGMAPSTISRARQHLMAASLIGGDGAPLLPELFWATSDTWLVRSIAVSAGPSGPDWVLGGDAAAAAWGAPVLDTDSVHYTADRRVLETYRLKHGVDTSEVKYGIALAPTPVVIELAEDGVVHPAVAALDLSRTSRGREILADWTQIESPKGSKLDDATQVWQ